VVDSIPILSSGVPAVIDVWPLQFYNLRVDPYVVVGVFLCWSPLGYCYRGAKQRERRLRMSIQRVMLDPIPLLILFGLILLTVWLWRRFKDR